jgi:hypothetical protein
MPKAQLVADDAALERDLIETLLAGHHQWRRDLAYPESHSDMQAAVRAALVKYEIKLRPVPRPLRYVCEPCRGHGDYRFPVDGNPQHIRTEDCKECGGKGYTESL